MSHYLYRSEGRDLMVNFDYTPEDVSLRINGIQAEPDYAASLDIESVYFKGEDIFDLLDPALLKKIEKEILGGV
jgi:hypothetical protein